MDIAVIGVGLVGSELVNQIIRLPSPSPFRIISLSSSTRSIFDHITSPSWKSQLDSSSEKSDLTALTHKLADLVSQSRKVTVVDNTASELVAGLHPLWLQQGINVVTPNKKAASGSLSLYQQIISACTTTGARYLHEATVGAGLPIISTLKELVATGDEVIKIEGVFSGTMSYIFNEFSTGSPDGPSFSSVVSVARQKGYTEPHPGDDLNGADVARKLTILARIIPSLSSIDAVQTASLIPDSLKSIQSGDEFINRLPEFDSHFARIRTEASNDGGQVLRYVGLIDVRSGVVKAGLERYPGTHPFATSLGGSDNIIMFHTKRYGDRPLIVQGAGAGAAVTAMGVLGDLFKLV